MSTKRPDIVAGPMPRSRSPARSDVWRATAFLSAVALCAEVEAVAACAWTRVFRPGQSVETMETATTTNDRRRLTMDAIVIGSRARLILAAPMRTLRALLMLAAAVMLISAGARALERTSQAGAAGAPGFQVDPLWPKMPKQWILGQVSG